MLKHHQSPYLSGRKRGHWWKHKRDPMTLDAVLIYAQAGRGRRANLFTDYTFALWDDQSEGDAEPQLVTFAKAYSGLNDAEILELDRWIRRHTRERFGPTRSVDPELVFEIGFEGIQESKRHKCGLAVRFPRILRWRRDRSASSANTLADARSCASASRTGQHERLEPLRARKNRVNPFQRQTISPSKKLIDSADQEGESKTREIIFSTPDTLQSLDISLRKPSIDWTIEWVVVRHDGVVPGPPRVITKIFQAKRMADFVNQRAFLRIGK